MYSLCHRMEGHGKYHFADGSYYEGHFIDGMCVTLIFAKLTFCRFHGTGVLYFKTGKYEGEWEFGKSTKVSSVLDCAQYCE